MLLDLRLPGKDGWAVLQELAHESFPIRVVVLTAALDDGEALKTLLRREAGGRELAKSLTPRDREMVHWVASGLHNQEIAEKLAISKGTVKVHLHHIYKKLQVPSRLALLQYVYQQGSL